MTTPFVAGYFSRFARVKMILPAGTLKNLTGSGNSETLRGCLVCFNFSHTKEIVSYQRVCGSVKAECPG